MAYTLHGKVEVVLLHAGGVSQEATCKEFYC
jgi:hypothetical protein